MELLPSFWDKEVESETGVWSGGRRLPALRSPGRPTAAGSCSEPRGTPADAGP